MTRYALVFRLLFALPVMVLPLAAFGAQIEEFFGTYVGHAEEIVGGEAKLRDMNVEIAETRNGFSVSWTSVTYKSDGRSKSKSYTIEFTPSQRDNIYGSAMQTNMFGKQTPLDPLKGEPFVWARLDEETLSLFSMYITEEGAYEMQEYHRTLVEGGLDLMFRRVIQGIPRREVKAFLKQVD